MARSVIQNVIFVARQQCSSHYTSGSRRAAVHTFSGSLQKVQGHRAAQGHRAGVNADLTPSTGGRSCGTWM